MDDKRFKKIAEGLWKAASMSADDLAARKGEEDTFVKIKRNSERLQSCPGHSFQADPYWRKGGMLYNRTIHCTQCGGDLKVHDAMEYLRGFAHGSGRDYTAMVNALWPPGDASN